MSIVYLLLKVETESCLWSEYLLVGFVAELCCRKVAHVFGLTLITEGSCWRITCHVINLLSESTIVELSDTSLC